MQDKQFFFFMFRTALYVALMDSTFSIAISLETNSQVLMCCFLV